MNWDYHGECDLVLLTAPNFQNGLGLQVHVRTTIQFSWSYIESASLKIGEDVFELGSYGEYFLNGVESPDLAAVGMADGRHKITYHQAMAGDHVVDKNRHRFQIDLDEEGHYIELSTWKHFVNVQFHVNFSNVQTAGLLGDYSSGAMLGRDLVTILDDANDFGQEWQVQASEPKLFQVSDRAPQAPEETCRLPTQKSTSRGLRLGSSVARAKAEEACAPMLVHNRKACVEDVLATGDLDLARSGAY